MLRYTAEDPTPTKNFTELAEMCDGRHKNNGSRASAYVFKVNGAICWIESGVYSYCNLNEEGDETVIEEVVHAEASETPATHALHRSTRTAVPLLAIATSKAHPALHENTWCLTGVVSVT